MPKDKVKDMIKEAVSLRRQAHTLAQALLTSVSESEDEDFIRLTKAPGKKGAESLDIKVDIYSDIAILPYYVSKVIECAADHAEVSYEEMVELACTFHKVVDGTRDTEKRVRHEPVQ